MHVEAEAWGLLEAIKFVVDKDTTSVIFESDYKVIVDIMNSSHMPQNELGDILSNCKDLLSIHTSSIMNYVRKQANEVAHSIARASLSNPSPHVFYIQSWPMTLLNIISMTYMKWDQSEPKILLVQIKRNLYDNHCI